MPRRRRPYRASSPLPRQSRTTAWVTMIHGCCRWILCSCAALGIVCPTGLDWCADTMLVEKPSRSDQMDGAVLDSYMSPSLLCRRHSWRRQCRSAWNPRAPLICRTAAWAAAVSALPRSASRAVKACTAFIGLHPIRLSPCRVARVLLPHRWPPHADRPVDKLAALLSHCALPTHLSFCACMPSALLTRPSLPLSCAALRQPQHQHNAHGRALQHPLWPDACKQPDATAVPPTGAGPCSGDTYADSRVPPWTLSHVHL